MTYLFYRFVHLGMTSNTLRNRDNRGVLKHDSGCWQIFPQNDSPFVFTSLFRIAIVSIMCLVMSLVGCSGEKARELRTLVAPVTSQFPYEFEGEIGANWGGDEYQVHHNGVIHWIRLIGVNGPEPAQPMHTKIRIMMVKKWYRKKATVFVDSIDEAKCEIGRVVVEGTDLSLYLVQQGYGWYDGSDCEYSAEYEAAEKEARAKRIGIWQGETPIDPLEFRKQELESRLEQLREEMGD